MSEEEKEQTKGHSQPTTERESVNNELHVTTQPLPIINEPSNIMEVQKHPHHVMHKKKWGAIGEEVKI